MNNEIRLPRVVGTRPAVAPFLASLDEKLAGQRVVLDCRSLLSGMPSFADEVVEQILLVRGADELLVIGATTDFGDDLRQAARDHAVSERVHLEEPASSASASAS